MFRIGQKVVCVNDRNWRNPSASERFPKRDSIYSIRAIRGPYPDGCYGLYLSEIVNPPDDDGVEWTFCATRFRPIVDKSTDTGMAILREILDRETIADKPRKPVRA